MYIKTNPENQRKIRGNIFDLRIIHLEDSYSQKKNLLVTFLYFYAM